jgi:hypothetical protein
MIYKNMLKSDGIKKVHKLMWEAYLHDIGLPVDHRLDEDGITERALPDDLKLPVLFHIKFK